MVRLRRKGVKVPADWKEKVDKAFPDAAAFWKKARTFEKLAEHGAKRKLGFAAYAPGVLPVHKTKKKPEFPPVWQKHKKLKLAITGMSKGFCAYCQSPVTASHAGKVPGQVEHFAPKSRFPTRAYEVGNYFLSCEACNGYKDDNWPTSGYVRPDRGKPGKRFVFSENGRIKGRARDAQAKNMVEDFQLDRIGLVELRRALIKPQVDRVREYIKMAPYLPARLKWLAPPLAEAFSPVSEAINQNVLRAWTAASPRKRK